MTKKTAVEWLVKELESYGNPQFFKIEWEQLDLLIQQAKEMHKQEIENSYLTCHEEYTADGKHWEMGMNPKETFEQYYNKTYGDNQSL
jgi:hypothetical protein